MRVAQDGDIFLLVNERESKQFLRKLETGQTLQTHRGMIVHADLIGLPFGTLIKTHLGFPFYLLRPSTEEFIRNIRRESQIIFPKDSGYIIMKMGIKPGVRVLECGTGSGGLCLAFATMVGESGHVFSYDVREKMQKITARNLRRADLTDRVTLKQRDAIDGFDETDVDALFLDMIAPWEMLDQAHDALQGGGILGSLVPTANQLVEMINALTAHPGFTFIEAEELILRAYKTVPSRIRPDDRMVGHTGYLIFSRAVIKQGSEQKNQPITEAAQDAAEETEE